MRARRASSDLTHSDVCDLYESGVAAVVEQADAWSPADWGRPACGQWDRTDTVRHLCAVITWYHTWLDRAVDGDSSPPFEPDEFEQLNQAGVDERHDIAGPEAVARFERDAGAYLDRTSQNWDLDFGFPLGTVTVGHHVAVAATEWHLHAWDLTSSDPHPHTPERPIELFRATGEAMAELEGGLRGRLLQMVVPVVARRAPWESMLKRSGRNPWSLPG